jgi:imidazolonepropionase-like amidohydrolase
MTQSNESPGIAITDVTVVDPPTGTVAEHRSVMMRGSRIVEVGDHHPDISNFDGTIVDGAGRWLIPGFWDMHVHEAVEDLDLFIAAGVTGVRDLSGAWEAESRAATEAIAARREIGPRMILGAPIDGEGSVAIDEMQQVSDVRSAQALVAQAQSVGADFVKVFSFLSRETFSAIAEAARTFDLPFGGHVPYAVTAEEAANAGQWTIEHLTGVLHGGSTAEHALLRDLDRIRKPASLADWVRTWMFDQAASLVQSQDVDKRKGLLARFAEAGTWHVPTLAVLRDIAYFDDLPHRDDPRRRRVPPEYYGFFDQFFSDFERTVAPETRVGARERFDLEMQIVGEMRDAGVGILAGTDGPPSLPAGASLHDELAQLVQAGLTPLEALRSATSEPARALGLEDMGTIRAGAVADLVLLDGDPVADIRNTERIRAVVADGRLFDNAQLEMMVERRSAAAAVAWDRSRFE